MFKNKVITIDLIILTKFAFMNCIICANNKTSQILEEYIGKSSSLNLIGTFSDSVSIRDQLSKRHDIDLIFLDVDLPEMDLFNFINTFGHQANIIIVSPDDRDASKHSNSMLLIICLSLLLFQDSARLLIRHCVFLQTGK